MILHHITDDSKLVKVAATTLSAKRLLECYRYIGYVVAVPDWLEDGVGEPVRRGRGKKKGEREEREEREIE